MTRASSRRAQAPMVRIKTRDDADRKAIRRAVLRLGLDRRRVYVIQPGYCYEPDLLATDEKVTGPCSGCACDCHPGCSHVAVGCHECGYTGKRVTWFANPVEVNGKFVRLGR